MLLGHVERLFDHTTRFISPQVDSGRSCQLWDYAGGPEPSANAAEVRLPVAFAAAYLRFARTSPGPYRLLTSRLLDDDHRIGEIVALRARAMGGIVGLIISAAEIDQPQAKFRGIAMWSMLHGHLTLDDDTVDEADRHSGLDGAIALLATRMALLPADGDS